LQSLSDTYDWNQVTAQVRAELITGGRALHSVQVRYSRYAFEHAYAQTDSAFYQFLFRGGSTTGPAISRITNTPISDGNHVEEGAVSYTVAQALGPGHFLEGGVTASYTTSRFDVNTVAGLVLLDDVLKPDTIVVGGQSADSLIALRRAITQDYAAGRLALFATDQVSLTERLGLELGMRLTRRQNRPAWYAEPRLSVRYDHEAHWSARMAAGLYRQFIGQYDISTSNLGALLPALRFWVPVDDTRSPPKALHLAADGIWQPGQAWTLRAEAFAKRYASFLSVRIDTPAVYVDANLPRATTEPLDTQDEYLEVGRGATYGGGATMEYTGDRLRALLGAAWNRTRRRTPSRFDGRAVPVPWAEPWTLDAAVSYRLGNAWTLRGQWRGVWGRTNGFRQIYYDYLAGNALTRAAGPYDLGDPAAHVLSPLYQLDLGLDYRRAVGPATLHLRADLFNALGRSNVAEWRLRYDAQEEAYRRTERLLLPRTLSGSVRLSW
jgi:hypothetical protein